MPTIFSHAVFAAVTGRAVFDKSVPKWFWCLVGGCAMIPDADVIAYSFDTARGSMFAHRGLTHSICCALIFGAIIAAVAHKFLHPKVSYPKLVAVFALATFSHPLLDMLTSGGSGVALFAPFSNERYFFPWRPVEVSPIGFGFFSSRSWAVMTSEILWIWFPAIGILILATFVRKLLRKH